MIDILTITASALIGGAGVYLWMRSELSFHRDRCLYMRDDRDRLQAELDRLTDRDDRGRYVRREP
jgi:hypothetical protein